jgi:vacuolar-type H+-ATPase subunit F/Vma7
MSQFVVMVRSELAEGFRLAGARTLHLNAQEADEQLRTLLNEGTAALLAIEEGLLDDISQALLRRVGRSDKLFYVAIPGLDGSVTVGDRLGELVEQAVGFSLGFGEGA